MKKLFVTVSLMVALAVNACWFPGVDIGRAWYTISGINEAHNVSLRPGMQIAGSVVATMPLTVYISKQMAYGGVDTFATVPVCAVLQYRVLPSGNWKTAVAYEDMDWALEDSTPYLEHEQQDFFTGKTYTTGWYMAFPFFGQACINLNVPDGTEVLVRAYFSDGVGENFPFSDEVHETSPGGAAWGDPNSPDWEVDYVVKVIIQGKRPFR